jgi:hypothetical protein
MQHVHVAEHSKEIQQANLHVAEHSKEIQQANLHFKLE